MRNETDRIAVTSRSFSKDEQLRAELSERYKNVTFNDEGVSLKGDALIEYLKGHDKAIIALEKMTPDVLEALPELKIISKYGVGIDNLDFDTMKKQDMLLGWTPGVNAQSVAELTLSMMINVIRNTLESLDLVKSGGWKQIKGNQLSSQTVGIIGCGHVGKRLVEILEPFGCRILVHDLRDYPEFYNQHKLEVVDIKTLLTTASIVTIHIPYMKENHHFIDVVKFDLMQKDAVFINTARGGIVDENALFKKLINGELRAAAMDVFEYEPPDENKLIGLSNFYPTSHIGGSAYEAILAMGRAAISGLDNAKPVEEFKQYIELPDEKLSARKVL